MFGRVEELRRGVLRGGREGAAFEADPRDAEPFVEDVDEPAGFEADVAGGVLVDVVAVFVGGDVAFDPRPVLAAEFHDPFLVRLEVVGGVFVAHLEHVVRCVPVF